jgi:hypothetical protein
MGGKCLRDHEGFGARRQSRQADEHHSTMRQALPKYQLAEILVLGDEE